MSELKFKNDLPVLLLAKSWDEKKDLRGWWLSEKLDGVRAYWTGTEFVSRNGKTYVAPDWFCEDIKGMQLDGELWMGQGRFQELISCVRRKQKNINEEAWKQVKFMVFDAPLMEAPFEERINAIRANFEAIQPKYAELLNQIKCVDNDHVQRFLAEIEAIEGEGIMARQPGSLYGSGRRNCLLKIKSFHDIEGEVIEHLPGKGKHSGRMGAIRLMLGNGRTVKVGTGFTDVQRHHPPPIGSTVTIRFQEMTKDEVPRFPSFLRVRED